MNRGTFSMALCLILAMGLTLIAGADGMRQFTDHEGRSINAKLLRPYGIDRVELQREDGERFIVSPEVFSAEDQAYISNWLKQVILREQEVIRTSVLTRYGRKQRDESSRGLLVERYPGYYRVTLENRSDLELGDLTVEYRCFAFKNEVGSMRRGEGRVIRSEGSHKVKSLPARGKIEFNTDEIELMDTTLRPGFVWADGGRGKSSDRMDGIWLRVMREGSMIAEFAQPSALPERHDW